MACSSVARGVPCERRLVWLAPSLVADRADPLEQLAGLTKEILYTMALAMPRMVGTMTALSFMGPNMLGGALARNGIAAALSLLVYPIVSAQIAAAKLSALQFAGAAAKEFLVGMLVGSVVMVVFWSVQAVGNFIDNQRGATMASSMDPLIGEQSSPLGHFMTQSMVAVFFATGLFNGFLGGVYHSYKLWPATSFWPSMDINVVTFIGRVGNWRAYGRVRWRFRCFRVGPQSGSHGHVSSPRSSNRACGFPAHGSRTRSCLRPREADRLRSKVSEPVFLP